MLLIVGKPATVRGSLFQWGLIIGERVETIALLSVATISNPKRRGGGKRVTAPGTHKKYFQ